MTNSKRHSFFWESSSMEEYLQDTGERLVDWWWRSHSLDQLLVSPWLWERGGKMDQMHERQLWNSSVYYVGLINMTTDSQRINCRLILPTTWHRDYCTTQNYNMMDKTLFFLILAELPFQTPSLVHGTSKWLWQTGHKKCTSWPIVRNSFVWYFFSISYSFAKIVAFTFYIFTTKSSGNLLRALEWSGFLMPLARSLCNNTEDDCCLTK